MRALRFKLEKLPINSSLNQETPMTILILESTMGSATLADALRGQARWRSVSTRGAPDAGGDKAGAWRTPASQALNIHAQSDSEVMGWLATSSRIRTMASQMDQGRRVEESGCKRRITSKELTAAIACRVFKVSRMLGSTGEELRRATHRVRSSMASQRREAGQYADYKQYSCKTYETCHGANDSPPFPFRFFFGRELGPATGAAAVRELGPATGTVAIRVVRTGALQ
ncbi:hypothetical protein DFH09DRAFT_1295073 [Mycena vulgaris]|nr:hypothetical protein DFH09DRAFT_1295073 [Mycena vulgaris]